MTQPRVAPARKAHRPAFQVLKFTRAERVKPALDRLLDSADRAAHLKNDPVELVHRYARPEDQEVVALLASAIAYGRVSLFKPRLAALLNRLGSHPAQVARESKPQQLLSLTSTFNYRMTGPAELAALLAAAGRIQRDHGSLGSLAESCFTASSGHLRAALDSFVATLWDFDLKPFIGQRGVNRRLAHLVASPAGSSACKRLNLYVRWMVRSGDGVDFGLWRIPTSALVIPLDTHVHRISRFLGLTRRTDLSWRTAEDITARLRHLDPEDPVKYDFALSHLGISGECPSRRDAVKCGRCPLRSICRMWDGVAAPEPPVEGDSRGARQPPSRTAKLKIARS